MRANTVTLGKRAFSEMILAAADAVDAEHAHLSRLDAVAGDGDHGVNLRRAMDWARSSIESLSDPSPGRLLRIVADACAEQMGGASGALFGAFFTGAADVVGDRLDVDSRMLAEALSAGCERVQRIGKASVGDRSMVDALAPAADAAAAAWRCGSSPRQVLAEAASAARAGADQTRGLVPAVGRARHAGNRALDVPDPGATAVALIFEAWARAVSDEGR